MFIILILLGHGELLGYQQVAIFSAWIILVLKMSQRTLIMACLLLGGCSHAVEKMPWPAPKDAPQGGTMLPQPTPVLESAADSKNGTVTEDPSTPTKTRQDPSWVTPQWVRFHPKRNLKPTSISLDWPLAATGITSLYGPRPDPLEKRPGFHYGVDMSAEYGTVVQSTAAGRVILAGWNGGHGRRVVIQHIAGYRTSYSHLSQITVVQGSWIESGHSIGRVGNSGRSTGPHLHLEVTRFGEHLDPLDLLGTKLSTD